MKHLILFLVMILSTATVVFAHGGGAPGPHGGAIQMPANFHTEVVAEDGGSFRIYLLDMEFKNPVTKNSGVEVDVVKGKKQTTLECVVVGDGFQCKAPKPVTSGILTIKAMRDGSMATMEAKYELPLTKGTP